jgi:hypothetical protein
MFVSGKLLGSPRHQLEGSNQAAFCQLYLETILALRAGISKRGFGSYSKLFLAGGLSFQGRFGLERASAKAWCRLHPKLYAAVRFCLAGRLLRPPLTLKANS